MMAYQEAFVRGQSSNHNHGAHSSPYNQPSAVAPPAQVSQIPPNGYQFKQQTFPKPGSAPSPGQTSTSGQPYRPAIKAQYLPPVQAQPQPQPNSQQPKPQAKPKPQQTPKPQETMQPPNQNSKPKTATVFKPYKVSTWNSR